MSNRRHVAWVFNPCREQSVADATTTEADELVSERFEQRLARVETALREREMVENHGRAARAAEDRCC